MGGFSLMVFPDGIELSPNSIEMNRVPDMLKSKTTGMK